MPGQLWPTAVPQTIAPFPADEMSLAFFCKCRRDDFRHQALLDVHLLQAPVFLFEPLDSCHQRDAHAAELGAPLVERGVADAVLAVQLWYWAASFASLENGDDLGVVKGEVFMLSFLCLN